MNRIDDRIKEIISPVKIISTEGNIKNAESLLINKDLQIGLNESDLCEINGKASLTIDFGKEYHGSLRIITYIASYEKIRIRLGESISECSCELGIKGGTNDHSLRDIETYLQSYSDMDFCQSGFRFARIDFLEDKVILLKSILLTYIHRSIEQLGSFKCNDEIINKIYDTAAYTCHLNMQTFLWDGIKRDRLVWIGDIHPEMKTIVCMYGKDKCIEESLDFTISQTPLPNWMNGISSYSFWWIIILHDYYFQNKNYEYLVKNKSYLVDLIAQIDGRIHKDKLDLDEYLLDWPSHETVDEIDGIISLLVIAMQKATVLLNVLNENNEKCYQILDRLKDRAAKLTDAKQVLAFNVLSERITADTAYNKLVNGGAKGLSTFMSYYILKAIAKTDVSEALKIMKEFYNGMLEMGATTFWEDFSIDWMKNSCRIDEIQKEGQIDIHGDFGNYCYVGFRHSLCHGWSSGPVSFLTEEVLGVKVKQAGCDEIEIAPNLCGLKYVEGKYPTPYGVIDIKHELVDGKIFTELKYPESIKITTKNCVIL